MSNIEDILVPDLSGASDVDVIEVLVSAGDEVSEGDSLITVETDKASMEVPAPKSGVVKAIMIAEGGTCNTGDVILQIESADAAAVEEPVAEAAPVEAPAAVSGGIEEVVVPDLSGATDVDVIEVLISAGDEVSEGDSLITVETDKASMEVPAPKSGTVTEVVIVEGSTCNEGDLILKLEVVAAPVPVAEALKPAVPAKTELAPVPAPAAPKAVPATTADLNTLEQKNRSVHAGPAVRATAREFGVDLSQVSGTGRKGRVLKNDVQQYVKATLSKVVSGTVGIGIPSIPKIDFAQFGEVELQKLTKVDRITRDNMSRCWLNIPHVTQFDKADITDLEAFRKSVKDEAVEAGVRLTPLAFMIKAVATALKDNPRFNTSLDADGEHLVYKKYINIGIAVDTPNGLMVPVIKDADKKSLYQLAEEVVELAGKAKNRKLLPSDMQGGCFTISSLGGIGGTGFTPIVNAPEVAILGLSKADIEPRWNGKEFKPRKMLPLCLSYDHRAINGGDAGKFLTKVNALLSDIRRLAL